MKSLMQNEVWDLVGCQMGEVQLDTNECSRKSLMRKEKLNNTKQGS